MLLICCFVSLAGQACRLPMLGDAGFIPWFLNCVGMCSAGMSVKEGRFLMIWLIMFEQCNIIWMICFDVWWWITLGMHGRAAGYQCSISNRWPPGLHNLHNERSMVIWMVMLEQWSIACLLSIACKIVGAILASRLHCMFGACTIQPWNNATWCDRISSGAWWWRMLSKHGRAAG